MGRLKTIPPRLGKLPTKRQQVQQRYAASIPGDPYKTAAWQKLRRQHLDAHPHCVMCLRELGMIGMGPADVIVACASRGADEPVATVCDHIKPHRIRQALLSGDEAWIAQAKLIFWDRGNLQSLCSRHHDSDKQRIERGTQRRRVGLDGWPVED